MNDMPTEKIVDDCCGSKCEVARGSRRPKCLQRRSSLYANQQAEIRQCFIGGRGLRSRALPRPSVRSKSHTRPSTALRTPAEKTSAISLEKAGDLFGDSPQLRRKLGFGERLAGIGPDCRSPGPARNPRGSWRFLPGQIAQRISKLVALAQGKNPGTNLLRL
jgi:hypothetical protein